MYCMYVCVVVGICFWLTFGSFNCVHYSVATFFVFQTELEAGSFITELISPQDVSVHQENEH